MMKNRIRSKATEAQMQATTIPVELDENLMMCVGGKMCHNTNHNPVLAFLGECTHRELAVARGVGLDFNKPLIQWDPFDKYDRPYLQDGVSVWDDLANRGQVDLLIRLLKMTDIHPLHSPQAKEFIARARRLKEDWRDRLPQYNAGLCATSETINQQEARWAKEKAEREAEAAPPTDNLWGQPLWFQALFGVAIYVAVIVGYIAFVEFVGLLWQIKLSLLKGFFIGVFIGFWLAFGFFLGWLSVKCIYMAWTKIKADYAKLPRTWDFVFYAIKFCWWAYNAKPLWFIEKPLRKITTIKLAEMKNRFHAKYGERLD